MMQGENIMNDRKLIAVIFGGQSSEHEVSRVSAESVVRNIDTGKYDVVMIGITKDGHWLKFDGPVEKLGTGEWEAEAKKNAPQMSKSLGSTCSNSVREFLEHIGTGEQGRKIDAVFPVLHGCNGEDGTIQGLFELAGIPYAGCGVLGSALGMDKGFAKIIFEKEGIPQARYTVLDRKDVLNDLNSAVQKVKENLGFPCFIKPCNAGSSIGVGKARNEEELKSSLMAAGMHDRRILAEEFIDGREVECAVLGNDNPAASVVGEIIPCREFYDYEAKYGKNSTSEIRIPAELPEGVSETIREYSVRAFKALGCAGLSRVDFFVHRKTGKVYINEINTMPGFTSISMYPKLWEACGISYKELIERLIELAFERFESSVKSTKE
jgi:D-alanine-D-alanine ligase